eukprot:TRINITY_DN7603_c0_g1_i2.p1 TRINITY_DN7603_c0_g1~~TRINITY_DN7603_c0_g1_i2.p1  ORF type:complete len:306 (+),score=28.61 TRINITY_DN7603_c0_g1_i2:59-919(+)
MASTNSSSLSSSSGSCMGIAYHNHRLYITDYRHNCLYLANASTGHLLDRWGQSGSASVIGQAPEFDRPWGVAIDARGQRVLVTDIYNSRVIGLDLESGLVVSVWDGSESDQKLVCPHGLAVLEEAGLVYVVDSGNYCVKAFRLSDGRCMQVLGKRGSNPDQFVQPDGLAMDRHYLYVTDFFADRISVFRHSDSTWVGVLGRGKGDEEGQLHRAYGVSADARTGLLYITDVENHKIQVWEAEDGSFVRQWKVTLPDGSTARPLAITCDPDNEKVYVMAYEYGEVLIY